jgi:cell division protein FtsW
VLLALTQTSLGFAVNGNRNWLALGPLTVQPSEIAKLAIICGRRRLRQEGEAARHPWHALIPVAPVIALISALVVFQHDLGTALVLFAILLGMLWVVGVPARLFGIALSLVGVVRFYLAASNAERRTALTSFIDPFKDFQGAGWQAATACSACRAAASSARALGAASRSGATCPRRTPTSSSRCSARSSGWSARCWCWRSSAPSRTPRIRLRINTSDPFVRYMSAVSRSG